MSTIRHEYYETDERVVVSIFDRNADPDKVSVQFQPRSVIYAHGDKHLELGPLKGQILPEQSSFFVGKVKIELKLAKAAPTRWGGLIGDAPDPLANSAVPGPRTSTIPMARKNWDSVSQAILDAEAPKTSQEDPNVNGDNTLNEFFQKLYKDADDDTRKAMMKSFQESGGTALSTNWDEVRKERVPIRPPQGSEARKWEA
ncbi:SGS-domain-containing protein [Vararia minispora EC-137]|uniref:SGS-domain-containing protein n=1 Tax=Vararia minispora EC-137 TaxID=1314806 RepID=A0ACB8QLX3_9AGAM|nr:SGS-domain-containing protein [Vararia minispora EC-137]